jgi:dipeptidyl aminopeptidase/acylaminoacyl peptidase
VTNGFVVIGSQYRGADGGEGMDEFGGADVNDVLSLIPLASSLGYVDMRNVFMHGASRGGMQAFLAIRKGIPINAVAVNGALTNLPAAAKERHSVSERVWSRLIPGFADKTEEVLRERSAVYFADRINVPVLILQGGADWRSNAGSQALELPTSCNRLAKLTNCAFSPETITRSASIAWSANGRSSNGSKGI